MFHVHKWIETRRAYIPPIKDFKMQSVDKETFLWMVFGLTTIELRCARCGVLKIIQFHGTTTGGTNGQG